jgi:hypothetical protein
MPSSGFTSPVGIRTEKPWHFSVKNIVPYSRSAMSHGLCRPASRVSALSVVALVPAGAGVPAWAPEPGR